MDNINKIAKNGLLIYDIKDKVTTAGPSPHNNERTEVFLLGCKKAMLGNPCDECFNSCTWDASIATHSISPIQLADNIAEQTSNKYITIGGGEPTDQIQNLIPFCKRLKEHGFHIIMYTWRDLQEALNNNYQYVSPNHVEEGNYSYSIYYDINELLEYIDIVIDGEYIKELKIYNMDKNDGCFNSVGSSNQRIYNIKKKNAIGILESYSMADIKSIELDNENNLIYHK